MPTLILEDGTASSASANTYVEVADVDTFCENRGLTAWASLSTANKEEAILRAMDYIESLYFKGSKSDPENPLVWPRYMDYETGIDEDEIPKRLKYAVCQAAYEESQSPGELQGNYDDNVKREKIDVIETEYFSAKPSQKVFTKISGFLTGLVVPKGMADVKRV